VSRKKGWTKDEYQRWSLGFGLLGATFAFIWLGTDWWFFGLCAIVCLVMSFWADLDAHRRE
jgi:hypothetical protein